MPNPYLTEMFRKKSRKLKKRIATSSVLHYNRQNSDTIPVVYLSFTPRMFFNVHQYKINAEYEISYLIHLE